MVGSFFVHIVAAFAMLMTVPEFVPPNPIVPISVTLVPESSIPGAGMQLQEKTNETGTDIQLNVATSTSPAQKTTEVVEAHNRIEDSVNPIQAPIESGHQSDADRIAGVEEPLDSSKEWTKTVWDVENYRSMEFVGGTEINLDSSDSEDTTPNVSKIFASDEEPSDFRTALVTHQDQILFEPTAIDSEHEMTAKVLPDAILDTADSLSIPPGVQNTEVERGVPVPPAATIPIVDVEENQTTATQRHPTDLEFELIAREYPDAIQDVIDEHISVSRFPVSVDGSEKSAPIEKLRLTESELAINQSENSARMNKSKSSQSALDIEQELFAMGFPDSILDVIDDRSTPRQVDKTVNLPKTPSVEENPQQSGPVVAKANISRTVLDAADKVEVRIAFAELDERNLLVDSAETIELSHETESNAASIPEMPSLPIVDEHPDRTTRMLLSEQVNSQDDISNRTEHKDRQPKFAKVYADKTDTFNSQLNEPLPLERARDADKASIVDTTSSSRTDRVASVQSDVETEGLAQSTEMAPQFGVPGLSNPAPKYPYLARANNEEGRVVLRVHVDSRGNAQKIETHTSSGFPRLDKAAKRAVRKWKFLPARNNGVMSDGIAMVPVSFVLTN